MRNVLLFLIRVYQWALSPYLGQNCRFYPTCSCYAHQAIAHHGASKGLGLTLRRLARCHPWNAGGYDPVHLDEQANSNPTSAAVTSQSSPASQLHIP